MRMLFAAPLIAGLLAATPLSARPVVYSASLAEQAGALVIPLSNKGELDSRAAAVDATSRAAIARALDSAEFDYKPKSTLTLYGIGSWQRVVIIGTGDKPLDAPALQDTGGIAIRETASVNGPVTLLAAGLGGTVGDWGTQLGVGSALASYSFDIYKAKPETPKPAGQSAPIHIVGAEGSQNFAREGQALVDGVYFTRDLISEPSNLKSPEFFVTRTREAFKGVAGVTIDALDVPAMEKLGMGAILSVGKGSPRPPRMLIVEYKGGGSGQPIVLAGKGITFDSGGISLKPGSGMWEMRTDMAGAATVVGTVLSLAKSRAPVNVVAIAALAENMPDGGATRPGDVVKAHNGKTIEILNTDAEGRLVLADAVAYAETRFKPAAIIDVATLTGAIGGALGDDYTGLFSRHDALAQQLIAAGKATNETLWQMPLHPDYAEAMKSGLADIKNVVEGGRPGAGLGAHFIGAFARPETPWAHLDVAFTVWSDKGSPTAPKGAVGYGVRLLDTFVRNWKPVPQGAGEGGY